MERFQPKSELLIGKSKEVADFAAKKARELLSRHAELLEPPVIDLIAQREATLAIDNYLARRREGHANDQGSTKPGFTVYLTGEARERVVSLCEEKGFPITDDQMEQVTPSIWIMKFPKGIYDMGGGSCQVYKEAAPDFEESGRVDKPFILGYEEIIRIEGDSNELWQNVQYNWDGTPKQS